MNPTGSDSNELPTAELRPRRRWSAIWLLPLACALLTGWLLYDALSQRGMSISVQFPHGHGLKAGDALRYRGIAVGTVEAVRLVRELDRIAVDIRLNPDAGDLARTGSRFWIVRPQLGLEGATGLETVVGANYVSVLPGNGDFQHQFIGLDEPPLRQALEPGGLEIMLTTPTKGNLRPGAPVSYRQVAVGAILSVDLARDASAVEAKIYIKPDYVALIRENTRFWKTGGARFSAGLTGLSVDVDSVRALILGGVSLALPPSPGRKSPPGQVFTLYEEPEKAWLEWTTTVPLHEPAANQTVERPRPLPAALRWQYKNLFYWTREAERRGWVLPVRGGFLGPADLLTVPENALPGSANLTVKSASIPLNSVSEPFSKYLMTLSIDHDYPVWTRTRHSTTPEDTLIVAGPAMADRFVPAARYRAKDSQWTIDPEVPFDPRWHGAAVVAQKDGALIGLLLVDEDKVQVAKLGTSVNISLDKTANNANLNSDVNTKDALP